MSPWHWLIVIGIAVVLFGARRLPDAARSLGRSARILRAELHGGGSAESQSGSEGGTQGPAQAQTTAAPAAAQTTAQTTGQTSEPPGVRPVGTADRDEREEPADPPR